MSSRALALVVLLLLPAFSLAINPAQAELIDVGSVHRIDDSIVHWSFMPDGAVLTVEEEGILKVSSFEKGILTTDWQLDLNITALTAEPDLSHALIAIGHTNGTLVVSTTLKAIQGWMNSSGRVDKISWGLDGSLWLGQSSGDRRANQFLVDGTDNYVHTYSHGGGLTDVVTLSDGRIVTSGYDDLVRIHFSDGSLNKTLSDFEDPVTSMLVTTDEDLVIATSKGKLYLYDTTTWNSKELELDGSPNILTIWQDDSNSIMASTNSKLYSVWINVWSLKSSQSTSGTIINSFYGDGGELYAISVLSSSTHVRLYDVDNDGDGSPNSQDAFPDDSTQQKDSDGDGYGDNSNGNSPDRWPNDPNEWNDTDGDRVGDNSDEFPNNRDQTVDTDGDGYGDNPDGERGDRYPEDASQWKDSDFDSYGDELNGTNGDYCPMRNGDSTEDRKGCPDSDNDGWSDPTDDWPTILGDDCEQGADAFPQEPTQWCDSDGDGFGDNPSGDSADLCPSVIGTSTKAWLAIKEEGGQDVTYSKIDYHGCIDSDGDGWADIGDDLPQDPDEHIDADHDGVGFSNDYDDNSALIKTLEDYCLVNMQDTSNPCKGVRDPEYQNYLKSVEEGTTPQSYSAWNKSNNANPNEESTSGIDAIDNKAIKEAGIVGGSVFVLMIIGILFIVLMQKRKRRSQLIKTYGVADESLTSSSEAEVLGIDGGVREVGGIEESDSWDDEIAPLQIGGDGMDEFADFDLSSDGTSEVSYDEAESIENLAGLQEDVEESEPSSNADQVEETAPEAPPVPEEGLPPGWTMEQWQWYGAQWLSAKKD